MRANKGTGNRIALVSMYDKIYVREGKGIGLPQCYFRCFILSRLMYKRFSSEKGILVDIFIFFSVFIHFSFFHFLTYIISHILLLHSSRTFGEYLSYFSFLFSCFFLLFFLLEKFSMYSLSDVHFL